VKYDGYAYNEMVLVYVDDIFVISCEPRKEFNEIQGKLSILRWATCLERLISWSKCQCYQSTCHAKKGASRTENSHICLIEGTTNKNTCYESASSGVQ
jgi:hypothetical protein